MVDPIPLQAKIDFHSNKKDIPYATIENFRKLVRIYKIIIQYNEITKEVNVSIPGKTFLPDNYLNCCIGYLTSLCHEHKMSSAYVLKFMLMIADENKVNPVKKWIESREWDHISRIDKFFATIESTNEIIKKTLITRWMVSAVAALYEPEGVSAGGMLVLLGKQYLGKTNWFKNLVSGSAMPFIQDGMSVDPRNRDSFMPCLENWLVELGEIDATFRRADLAALKAFINRQRDTTRLSYAAANSRFPRRTVFFGSVDKKGYLTDPAGNRRFWTIECIKIDHTHGLDMQQIWAEFTAMYFNKEPWLLTPEEHELLTGHNKEYEATDPMEERLIGKYNWDLPLCDWKTATQVLEEIGYKNISKSDATLCANMIRKYNGDTGKKNGKGRVLFLPPVKSHNQNETLWND